DVPPLDQEHGCDPCDAALRCAHAETLSASLMSDAALGAQTVDPASAQYNARTRDLSILLVVYAPARKSLPGTRRHHYPGGFLAPRRAVGQLWDYNREAWARRFFDNSRCSGGALTHILRSLRVSI